MSIEEIFRAALALPQEQRGDLADRLYESLEDTAEHEEWVRLWAREAEDRIAACDRGELAEIPGEEVFASLKLRAKG